MCPCARPCIYTVRVESRFIYCSVKNIYFPFLKDNGNSKQIKHSLIYLMPLELSSVCFLVDSRGRAQLLACLSFCISPGCSPFGWPNKLLWGLAGLSAGPKGIASGVLMRWVRGSRRVRELFGRPLWLGRREQREKHGRSWEGALSTGQCHRRGKSDLGKGNCPDVRPCCWMAPLRSGAWGTSCNSELQVRAEAALCCSPTVAPSLQCCLHDS